MPEIRVRWRQKTLYPAWGDNHERYGGFLGSAEFIDLLRYAAAHHVEIIPEFNLPGHANALLRSLDACDRYVLNDDGDRSTYKSAQGYTANVVNVCLPDTYRLAGDVLGAISAMYQSAGVPFSCIHFGGDETPEGAWLDSPVCRQSKVWQQQWDMNDPEDRKAANSTLMSHHYSQITQVAESIVPGIRTGFWHEMSSHAIDASCNARRYFNGWTTEAADRNIVDDLLADSQLLVISNASYLYLDMPHGLHADEPGLPWAAYISTSHIYHFDPLACWQIEDAQKDLVLGLQAQLWSETIYTPELMDYYVFPRLLAVAERCWNQTPDPANWSSFAAALGNREMPFLFTVDAKFRVPPPGAKIENDMLLVNTEVPGLEIRFSVDGTRPDINSPRYTGPVKLESLKVSPGDVLQLATFLPASTLHSRTVSVTIPG